MKRGWQRGYGVVSFGKQNLPWVNQYIARQKEHHARQSFQERLEWITAFEDKHRRHGRDAQLIRHVREPEGV